jgi:hypothetical protein
LISKHVLRMGIAAGLFSGLALAGAAAAAEVGIFRLDSRDEIVAGEADGTAIGPLGQIELGFALEKLSSFEEPFLLSAAPIPGGGFLVGTGNQGRVFKVDSGGASSRLAELAEGQIFSVFAKKGGELFAAGSPKAKVYRLTAKGAELFFDPGATYVWAMAEDDKGRLLVATGLPGKIYRVAAGGDAEAIYEGSEPHIRSLLVMPDGELVFGSAGQGLLMRRSEKGGQVKVETLYDAAEPEVAALTSAPDGRIFAALLASEASQVDLGAAGEEGGEAKAAEGEATMVGTRAAKASGPRSLVVELRGREVKKLFELQDETLHGLLFAAGHLWAGTGLEGRLYRYQDEVLVREATLEEKQLVALLPLGSGLAVATTDAAALYRLPGARRLEGEFTSKPLDAREVAAFGLLRAEANAGAGASYGFEARSGATEAPDRTWTEWENLPAKAGEPGSFSLAGISPARYLQVRAKLERQTSAEPPRLDAIEISYRQENRAPRIDKLEVLAPGEILVPAGFNPASTTFEPWSPNREGIFTSIQTEKEKGEGRLKSLFKKGYRTLRWSAADGNGDSLRYTLEVQPEGAGDWLKMVDKLDEDYFSFDSAALPDGRYRFRLRAEDGFERSAGSGLEASRITEPVEVDHSPPRVASQRAAGAGKAAGSRLVKFELEDASPLREVALSIDGADWQRLQPADGLLDGRRETFELELPAGSRFVVVRVTDAAFNVLTFPIEPR